MEQQYHPTFRDKRDQPMHIGQEVVLPVSGGVGLIVARIINFGQKQVVCGIEVPNVVWDARSGKRVQQGTRLETWKRYPHDVVVF